MLCTYLTSREYLAWKLCMNFWFPLWRFRKIILSLISNETSYYIITLSCFLSLGAWSVLRYESMAQRNASRRVHGKLNNSNNINLTVIVSNIIFKSCICNMCLSTKKDRSFNGMHKVINCLSEQNSILNAFEN